MSTDDIVSQRPRSRLIRLLLTLLGLAMLLLAILWVGQFTRERIAKLDRYTVALADVDCSPPPDQNLSDFLAEVQYVAGLPDHLRLLDDELPARLAEAFARHPEVEKVQDVKIVPPRQIRVRLTYRTPVLIVSLSESKSGEFFVVDGQGVLLRRSVAPQDLAIFEIARMTAGPAGSPCSDPNVIAAARTATFLHPYHAQLPISKIEGTADNLVLKFTSGQSDHTERSIIWGHGPGEEKAGEPKAEEKVRRLQEYVKSNGKTKNPGKLLDLRLKK